VALIALIYLVAFLLRKRKRTGRGPGNELFPETGFSTIPPTVSDSNRPPNAMTTSSLLHQLRSFITLLLQLPRFLPRPPLHSWRIHESINTTSMNRNCLIQSPPLPTFELSTPSIFASTSLHPLSDQHLSNNWAMFLAGLLRQGMYVWF